MELRKNSDCGENTPVYKIAVVGDRLCGKTSLINKFVKGDMNVNKRESVGLDFHYKMVVVDGREVKLQIFDHRSTRWRRPGEVGRGSVDVSANFLCKAAGLLLCFSLTDRNAVNSVLSWKDGCNDIVGRQIPCVLVGTKCDLDGFPEDNYQHFIDMCGFKQCYETSALTNEGVIEAFEGLIRVIMEHEDEIERSKGLMMTTSCIDLESPSKNYMENSSCGKESKFCGC